MKWVPDAPLHTEAIDLERILDAGRPTLVVFETPECEPCLRLVPILTELAREYAGRVVIVRVDASPGWLAARHHLSYVPTLAFWGNGEEQARIRGNPGEAAVRAHLEFLVAGRALPDPASGDRHALVASFGVARRRPRRLLPHGAPKG